MCSPVHVELSLGMRNRPIVIGQWRLGEIEQQARRSRATCTSVRCRTTATFLEFIETISHKHEHARWHCRKRHVRGAHWLRQKGLEEKEERRAAARIRGRRRGWHAGTSRGERVP